MRSTIARLSILLLVLAVFFYLFKHPTKRFEPVDTQSVAQAESLAYRASNERMTQAMAEWHENQTKQHQEWLKELSLEKPITCYETISEQIAKYVSLESCRVASENLSDKAKFQELMKGFKLFPLEDKFIIAKEGEMHSDVPCMYALFNKNSKLSYFLYDTCGLGNGDNFSNMHLEDWNKDGKSELLVSKRPTYTADGRFVVTEVYDVTSFDNKIVKVFEYQVANSLRRGSDLGLFSVVTINQAFIEFERPDLLKLTSKQWNDFDDVSEDDKKYKAQKAYIEEFGRDTTVSVVYYQQDKKTKKYIKVK